MKWFNFFRTLGQVVIVFIVGLLFWYSAIYWFCMGVVKMTGGY